MKIVSMLSLLVVIHSSIAQQPAIIDVDAAQTIGEMKPIWAFFGYDECNYTTRKNGQELLKELQQLSRVPVYIRTHNLLTSRGNSTGPDLKWSFTDAYSEDASGNPVYNWITIDSIIDSYVQRGMRPLMEIGFMPKALSSKPDPYEHAWSAGGNLWTGWTYPPKDYNKWRELVYQWVKHSIERYGMQEVNKWLWEVWNEPDIAYWSGSFEEYCKLYDYAADGLKRACSECTIGGPHSTSPRNSKADSFLTKFISHCLQRINYATGKKGTSLQYIGFHAKGSPELMDGHIRMDMGVQLKDIQRAFEIISSYRSLKNIPVIIGESDPEGCAACSEKRDPKYGYRNGTMYSSYTAASFARIYELMDKYKVNLRGAVSWSFEFEDQDWFAGFRDLATNGVDKPVLNVFRMFGMMKGQRIKVVSNDEMKAADIIANGVRGKNDINAIASKDDHSIAVMVWNYHDYSNRKNDSQVEVTVNGMPAKTLLVHHYRIDDKFSNSYEKWKTMGSPQQVSDEQYAQLKVAGQLQLFTSPEWMQAKDGNITLRFDLPAQAVSFIQITW